MFWNMIIFGSASEINFIFINKFSLTNKIEFKIDSEEITLNLKASSKSSIPLRKMRSSKYFFSEEWFGKLIAKPR